MEIFQARDSLKEELEAAQQLLTCQSSSTERLEKESREHANVLRFFFFLSFSLYWVGF